MCQGEILDQSEMEYLNYFDRQELITERARCRSELNQLKIKKEDEDPEVTQSLNDLKEELDRIIKTCDERLKAAKEEKDLNPDNSGQNSLTQFNGDQMVKSMQETAKMQQILDTVRGMKKMKPGDNTEEFVCGLNQVYCIEVKPLLTTMPSLETEFVNCAKGLLTYPMFTQLEKSGKQITTWSDLEKYLISTHGSKISNFQHLHRLWNCQLQEHERFADFGSRLEEKIHHASMHIQASFKKSHSDADMTADDVFNLVGAMLAAQQIRIANEDAYKSLIKTIDKNWSASSLLSDASEYADKMSSTETTVAPNVAFHAKATKPPNKRVKSEKKPAKSSSRKSDRLEDYKKKCANQICEKYLKGSCKYGDKCFRIHPTKKSALYTEVVQPEIEPEVDNEQGGFQNLFH